MPQIVRRALVALTVVGAVVTPVVTTSSLAAADPAGSCRMGTDAISSLQGVLVDGTSLSVTANSHVYTDSAGTYYAVQVCDDATNQAFSFSLANSDAFGTNTIDFTSDALTHTYRLILTMPTGETPLVAQIHAKTVAIDEATPGFAVNGQTVTINAQPLPFSDISSGTGSPNDCPPNNGPAACALLVSTASYDRVANWTGAIRYATATNDMGSTFNSLPGLTLSYTSYYFDLNASCPMNPNRDQSFTGLNIAVGGPHYMHDGTTLNHGYLQAFIPSVAIATCFGLTPDAYVANAQLSRTEYTRTGVVQSTMSLVSQSAATVGTDQGLIYSLSADALGVYITVPVVTFSKPLYKFKAKNIVITAATKTVAQLAAAAHVIAPPRGRVTLSVTSPKVCVLARGGKVYSFARGTCTYTLLGMSRTGVIMSRVASKFVVR
jgi:hypothetical protein